MKLKQGQTLSGKYRFKTYKAGTKELISVSPWHKNLISTASGHGLNIVMLRLSGDNSYSLEIDSAKIGTGSTPASEADTDLETPVTSGILIANRTFNSNVSYLLEFFIPNVDLPDGTYNEFGTFCGARMFSRSIISPAYDKASNTDTAVEYLYEISNV